jgi:hypothetical protein
VAFDEFGGGGGSGLEGVERVLDGGYEVACEL